MKTSLRMYIPAHKSILILLLSAIGLIALPHVYHIPASIFAFFYLLLGWRFIGIWKPEWLPNKWVVFMLMITGIALLYSQHQGLFGRDAGTRLFLTALALKLLEIKSERDLYLITYLAFIVAASQFLYGQSLLMGAYSLLVCCALFATLVCINSRKPQPLAALKTASLLVLQALPIAIVLFILFPRIDAPRWMLFEDTSQARSGLSDSMEPGSISELGLSDELVFRVRFADKLPPPAQRYWRGPVLSYTDGKRWTQTSTLTSPRAVVKPGFAGSPYRYTLLMEPHNKNWVFALDMPAEFSAPLSQQANYQLVSPDNPNKRAEYKITSYPEYNTGLLSRAEYSDAMQLPAPPSARIKQLVTQLHGFDSQPIRFISQLLNHFQTEDFHYTLTPPVMEDNPIETFLFETRHGFCSHYAAAFVYLMRVANIPARVVTGYQGGEYNKMGDFLEIRQYSAHAWAEVWLKDKGWVRVDPTAAVAADRIERNVDIDALVPGGAISFVPVSEDARAAYHWLKQARQLWNHVDYNWQRWVINYDNRNQAKFLSSLGMDDIKAMMYWMIASIALITALLSAFLLRQKAKASDQVLRIYQRFCKKLARRGVIKNVAEGENDFANRAKLRMPEQAADIAKITGVFTRLRYGRTPTSRELKQFSEWVRLFKV